jgi:hypothetical protein
MRGAVCVGERAASGQPPHSLSMIDRTARHIGLAPARLAILRRAVSRRAVLAAALLSPLLLGAVLPDSLAGELGPAIQQGTKLTGAEESGAGRFGRSVALSADGDTALIGAPNDDGEAGAAWVLARSGATWTQQAILTGAGESGAGHFGRSVALSADGDTALVGAPNDDGGFGAVWVFVRSGATWTQQAMLTGAGESGRGWFGRSVALSADGDTALIGGYVDSGDTGAAWVFARSGTTWAQQGAKLTGGEESGAGEFGFSVALSGDGETALIGGRGDGGGVGAAWVFARSGATWAQQGAKLTGGEESGEGYFGGSAALSQDGETALIGGLKDGGGVGAAWVFARSGATWAQQGPKLTGGEESGEGYLGGGVALSADGDIALIGGMKDDGEIGAAWVFARSGAMWAQQGAKLTGGEEIGKGQFGWSVALSADGETALIGGLGDDGKAGAAWVFTEQPAEAEAPPASAGTTPAAGGPPTPPATAPSAKQGVAGYRAVVGRVALLSRTIPVRGAVARVRLRCIAPVACRGRLVFAVRVRVRAKAARRSRTIAIATAPFSILRGRTATIALTLDAFGRTRLSAVRGHLRARLAIHVAVPDPPVTRTYAAKLVLQRVRRSSRPVA